MIEPVFDSNIIIDILADRPAASEELRRYADVAISIVTWIEVMAGTSPEREASIRAMLNGYRIIGLDGDVAERAAVIRRERRIKLPDAIIQATAEVHGLTLVTRNERDFPEGMPGVRIPYRITP